MNKVEFFEERKSAPPVSETMRGVRESAPILLSFIPFALLLGAQADQKGLSPVEVPLMTGLNFAGGSEFAAIGLWTSPPPILLIAAITLLVNSRHFLMGAALAPLIRHWPKRKAFLALFFMCDESWALGLSDARKSGGYFSLKYYFGASLSLYIMWVSFTTLGALIGPVLGDVTRFGFDMAFPAVFIVILAGMWKGPIAALPWVVSLLVACIVYLTIPGAWYVLAGVIAGLMVAWQQAKHL